MDKERSVKKIALIPVYNEEEKIRELLALCVDKIDIFVIINDGSCDGSKEILDEWGRGRSGVYIIHSEKNRGMSWAVKKGFRFIQRNRRRLEIDDDDVVVQIDADGQHSLENFSALVGYMKENDIDCLITKRRLESYPTIKIIGNYIMSLFGSILAWRRFYDIESGYRFIKVKTVAALLFYMVGYRYSWAQEMAVISSWLGLKIDNNQEAKIVYYRKRGTRIADALINCLFSSIILPVNWCFKMLIFKIPFLMEKSSFPSTDFRRV